MRTFRITSVFIVLTLATNGWGQIPTFSTTLDDDASITSSNGTLQNSGAHTYVAGAIGNAFQSTNSTANAGGWAKWADARVSTIFSSWNDGSGITVDLYFLGTSWSGTSGDEGLWSMVRRNSAESGATGGDQYFITSIRNGKLRILFANNSNNQFKYTFDGVTAGEIATNAPLTTGVTYRLTCRVQNGAFDVYLDDIGGATYSNAAPIFSATNLPAGYNWTLPPSGAVSSSGTAGRQTREMDVGNRGPTPNFGGTLRNGDWIDNVHVFNAFYTPAQLDAGGFPVAVIVPDVTSGFVPLTVHFDGSGSHDTDGGSIVSYQWDFDNNGTVDDSSGAIVTHQYATPGTYTCKLTVTDNENKTHSATVIIQVNSGAPVAVIQADVTSGFVPLTVNFDGSGSHDTDGGTIVSYQWDFDNDGNVDDSSGAMVTHQYAVAGTYTCKLTVTDNDNKTSSATVTIQVNAPAAAGLVAVTSMLPTGGPFGGSQVLTSITAGGNTFTHLVGPTTVETTGSVGNSANTGLCDITPDHFRAMQGLQLGRGINGFGGAGDSIRAFFPTGVIVNGDGTAKPEIFVLEYTTTTDNFQIQLLTSGPGETPVIAATVAVRSIDYAATATIMTAFNNGNGSVGGVGIDLDALGVSGIKGIQIPGLDAGGLATGLDPCLVAAVVSPGSMFAPVAVMKATPTSGGAPLPVDFDGSCGSYDPDGELTYQWDFTSDSITDATGMTTSHSYNTAGTFTAKLTVVDSNNLTATDSEQILITGANPKRSITAMLPTGSLASGSHTLTSVTTEMPGGGQTFTANTNLAGPPDTAHVEVVGTMGGGGAGATTAAEAIVGLELGSTVTGGSSSGEFLTGYFADNARAQPDGTNAPEIFVIEDTTSSDDFQIQLLTNGPGQPIVVAAIIQIFSTDYSPTATKVGGASRGGMGIDLDALSVANIRGIRIPGANGLGGGTGIDPVIFAGRVTTCSTPFADADHDGDVDGDDFSDFQTCYTGDAPQPGVFDAVHCFCFDREGNNQVDEVDFNAFIHCVTGPAILFDLQNPPAGCVP